MPLRELAHGLFALALFGCAPLVLKGQEDGPPVEVIRADEGWVGPDEVFVVVDRMPEFPGGQEALFAFIGEHIVYPPEAIDAGVKGTVYVSFIVEKDGTITNAEVLRGIGHGCDEEALRMVRAMPQWTGGTQRGTSVRVQYRLPIRFVLN